MRLPLVWCWAVMAISVSACYQMVTIDKKAEAGDASTSSADDASAEAAYDGPFYREHVKSIMAKKCVGCHTKGGSAPMALESYSDVTPWLPAIGAAVQSGRMPPWGAAPDCNQYIGDRSLTDKQKQTMLRWVEAGGPRGKKVPEEKPAKGGSTFRADVVLTMPEPYTPSLTPDEYRCFVMPWPRETPAYIAGVGLRPGNPAMVHHSVLYLVEPDQVQSLLERETQAGQGYECFTGVSDGTAGTSLIGAIEKAEEGWRLPHGTGLVVEPGSAILIQQHYNTLAAGKPEPDQTSIEFMVKREVESPAETFWFTNFGWMRPGGMPIPAGKDDVEFSVQYPALLAAGRSSFRIHWADLHMHTLGASGELRVVRQDGSEECLLHIDDWQFEWQETFLLKDPVTVGPGDSLRLVCNYDNTKENQMVVDGKRLKPRNVEWGDGSRDEMCLGNFLMSPVP